MQDAINEISGIMDFFPEIHKIGIINHDDIQLYYSDIKFKEKSFTNAIELLEWCEENLNEK